MAAPLVLSMVLKADAASAKAGLAEVRAGVKDVAAASDKATASTTAQATALDELAAAAARAARGQAELAQRARAAAPAPIGVAELASGFRAAETAAEALRASTMGLNRSFSAQAREAVGAAQDARDYRAALDEIRAAYNPLFAVSRQYERELEAIAEAERMGAISAREAADARARAAARMAPMAPMAQPGGHLIGGQARGANSFVTANLAAQGNDVMMMAMAGQNPLQLALQQGTQISQVLNTLDKGTSVPKALAAGFMSMVNPVSLATMGVIALGALGFQAVGKLIPKTKTLSEAVDALQSSVDAYGKAITRARSGDLAAEFGSAANAARSLLGEMAEIKRRQAEFDVTAAMKSVGETLGPKFFDVNDFLGPFRKTPLQAVFDVGNFDTEGMRKALAAQAAVEAAAAAEGLDAQIAALETARQAVDAAANHKGGVRASENDLAKQIAAASEQLLKQKAYDENASGKAFANNMAADLERQVEMAAKIARYGKDAAEVRALELSQARATAAEKLKAQGIELASVEGRRAMAAVEAEVTARHAADAEARRKAQADYHDGQAAQIAAIKLERQMLGATTAERLKAKALAEAELEIQRNKLSVEAAAQARIAATTRAAQEAQLEQARAARELAIALMTDAYDARIGAARDPVTKADLEAQREYARVMAETGDAARALGEAERVRTRSITEAVTAARTNIATISDELAARRAVEATVAAGRAQATDVDRLMRAELELRPLIAAAARAEGAEKAALIEIVTGLRIAQEAAAADERRRGANDLMRGQAEKIAALKVELALMGQSAETRARVLAMIEAEQSIRRFELDGKAADEVRRQARAQAELTAEVERQGDAWDKVRSSGEKAIDGLVDKLAGGDLRGALGDLAKQAGEFILELGVKNPIKNRLLGTNLGTLDDVGGLGGIIGRLFGGAPFDEAGLISQGAAPVQAMSIEAANVILNAGSFSFGGGAANLPYAPGATAPAIPGGAQAMSLLSSVAVGGGARADAISGLNAALADPLAAMVGEAQRLFGASAVQISSAFRSNQRQAQLWEQALAKYGSPEAARKWVAPPGRSNHNAGMAADLRYGSDSVQDWFHENAGQYGLRFPMGHEPWHIEPAGARGRKSSGPLAATPNVAAAEQALSQFGLAAGSATGQVGRLGAGAGKVGQGMADLGAGLSSVLGAAMSGNKAGALQGLLGLGFKAITGGFGGGDPLGAALAAAGAPVRGFAAGGATGGSNPARVAGVVHEGEYVFNARATARIGVANLERLHSGRMPGYATGGYVRSGPVPAAPAANSGSAPAGASGSGGGVVTMNFDLRNASGTSEIRSSVTKAVRQALEEYDREVLPRRVRGITSDPWKVR